MKLFGSVLTAIALLLATGCSDSSKKPSNPSEATHSPVKETGNNVEPASIVIKPGPGAQKEAQEALILAIPGEIIEFAEGTFNFDGTLSVSGIKDITIRGQGMKKTILNFSKMTAGKGGEGMKITADNFVLEDLTLEDTPGDAIKLQDCNGLTMRRVRTWWTGGPATENGAYGLYPVLSNDVLIEDCVAEGASDAGIYVGQSKRVIVRNCRAERNVAGIEIENCLEADVYNNVAHNNTGGILVFSLPGLTIKNGADCRIYNNELSENNHPNFAEKGAMVSEVPPGTGLMIMANDRVEVFDNKFDGNVGASCLIVSFLTSQRKYDDSEYDPYPESILIQNNKFSNGGSDPQGELFELFTKSTGQSLPDIVFDGILDASKLVDGAMPADLNLSITANQEATFVNLDLGNVFAGKEPKLSTELDGYSSDLPRVKPVAIPGVE
ncbi:MAG: parallel beta-helix repeat protein [Mariniblastus sp.]|jgi:parallel beta-helix repeat protein